MFDNIEQAESAIKAGDTKTGFEILRTYLADNPDSERAWWVMSGLVQREERATCLEQVLRINPENRLARETLEKIRLSPPEPETKPQRELPSAPAMEGAPAFPLQTFLFKKGSRIYLTLLDENKLTRAHTTQANIRPVRDAVKNGQIPEDYLSDIKVISLDSIQSVKHKGSGLLIQYLEGDQVLTLDLPFEDKAKARTVLGVLTKKLGPNYMIQSKPISTGLSLGISSLLTLGSAAFVAAILWTMPQIGAGLMGDSWRTRMVSRLLESLGYGGVILICVALVLAALGLSAYLLLKPPIRTELVQRS